MSGPALKQINSHSSIHAAAIGEAEHLTDLLRMCLARDDQDQAYETACVLLEHWETRTLAHAEAEEEGLYMEFARDHEEVREMIIRLTRDHDLMRRMADEIRSVLAELQVSQAVLMRFEAMILIDLLHNREEEQMVAKYGGDHHD